MILDGRASYDPDGDRLWYSWTVDGVELSTEAQPSVHFFEAGIYELTLTVTDADSLTASDTVTVDIRNNLDPVANAGDNQIVQDSDWDGQEDILLDGSGSSDPDNALNDYIAYYAWSEDGEVIAEGPWPEGERPTVTVGVGTHSVTLTVWDTFGATSTDTTSITVLEGPNRRPEVEPIEVETYVGQPVEVTLEGSDPDGDELTFEILSLPAYGTISVVGGNSITNTPAHLACGTDTLDYQPMDGFFGPDSFAYRAVEEGSEGATSDIEFVRITVSQMDYPPTAFDLDIVATSDNTTQITLDAVDANPEELIYVITSLPQHATLHDPETGQAIGSTPYDLANHGKDVDYTPDSGYLGDDLFYYRAKDASGSSHNIATVDITVRQANRAPVADDVGYGTTSGSELSFALIADDADGDWLTFTVTALPNHGTLYDPEEEVTVSSVPYTLPYRNDVLVYQADGSYTGTDSINFSATDGTLTSNSATVTFQVSPAEVHDAWPTYVVDSTPDPAAVSIATTPDGRPAIAYEADPPDQIPHLRYAEYNQGSGQWDVVAVDPDSRGYGEFTSLQFGPDGEPAIAYYEREEFTLRYAHRENGQWYTEEVDGTRSAGHGASLRFDPTTGHPVIAYVCTSGDDDTLRLARYNGSNWDIDSSIDIGGFSKDERVNLELDQNGNPHIVYYISFRDDDDVLWRGIKYARKTSGSWDLRMIAEGDDLTYPETVSLSENTISLIYYDHWTSQDGVYYTQGSGNSWSPLLRAFSGTVTSQVKPDIALAPQTIAGYAQSGQPAIAFGQQNPDTGEKLLYYGYRSGGLWHKKLLSVDPSVALREVSLTFDGNGYPAIAICSPTEGLKFATPFTTLTTAASPVDAGTVQRDPDDDRYFGSVPVQLTAEANAGWQFSHWTGDVAAELAEQNPITVVTDAPKSLTAVFEQVFSLQTSVSPAAGGTVAVSPNGVAFPVGSVVQWKLSQRQMPDS